MSATKIRFLSVCFLNDEFLNDDSKFRHSVFDWKKSQTVVNIISLYIQLIETIETA